MILNELLPHEASGGVVGVREEDVLVKERFHVFLATFMRLRTAPNNEHSGVILEELLPPCDQRLLNP